VGVITTEITAGGIINSYGRVTLDKTSRAARRGDAAIATGRGTVMVFSEWPVQGITPQPDFVGVFVGTVYPGGSGQVQIQGWFA